MRRAGSKTLGRQPGTRERFRRVFVACEGHKSEIEYLRELLRQSEVLGLRGRVEVIILDRYETDSGLSYPMQVIQMTADHMEYLATDRCSENLFLSIVRASAGTGCRGDVKELSRDPIFWEMCENGYVRSVSDATEYATEFMSKRGYEISLSIDYQMYDSSEDYVCIVIDRDAGKERPEKNYREFIDACTARDFKLFVTNPKFEFWILMHLPDICDELEAIAGDRNPSAATDRVMKSRGLVKGKMDFEEIVSGLNNAMNNSRSFHRSLEDLEASVGTNLSEFIGLLERGEPGRLQSSQRSSISEPNCSIQRNLISLFSRLVR